MDRNVLAKLAAAEADLALGIVGEAPADIFTRIVFADRYVCALRAEHPALARRSQSRRSIARGTLW